MSETIKIGNSWYVLEDICGIIGPQDPKGLPAEPPKMLLRGGHILAMTEMSEDVIEYIRQLRDPPPEPLSHEPRAEDAAPEVGMGDMEKAASDVLDMEIVNEAGV